MKKLIFDGLKKIIRENFKVTTTTTAVTVKCSIQEGEEWSALLSFVTTGSVTTFILTCGVGYLLFYPLPREIQFFLDGGLPTKSNIIFLTNVVLRTIASFFFLFKLCKNKWKWLVFIFVVVLFFN